MARLRNTLSALVLWCVFLVLYLAGVAMLAVGLILASRVWWAAVSQHSSLWSISAKTAEVLVLGVGLLFILIIPLFHHRSVGRSGAWRMGRRAETDCPVAADKNGPLIAT